MLQSDILAEISPQNAVNLCKNELYIFFNICVIANTLPGIAD